MKFKFFTLVVLATMLTFSGFSQTESRKPIDLVAQSKYRTPHFQEVDIFNIDLVTSRSLDQVDRQVEEYDLFDIDDEALAVLIRDMPSAMTLSIPINFRESMELELVAVDIFSSDFTVMQRSDNSVVDVNTGLHYRGIIKGDNNSIAAISIYKDEVKGLISSDEGNLVIGKLQNRTSDQKHIIYDDANVLSDLGIECGTEYDGGVYRDEQLEFDESTRDVGDCVRFYVEVDKDIHDEKGGTAGATNYVTGLMNQVSTLYANEQIATVVSQIVVWDVASPFVANTSVTMLNSFAANTNNINGDLGILLSYRTSGGVANYYAGLCNANVDLSLCFAAINNTYSAVPTYSWSVGVITHEFGHLFGSYHTHACVWNGNNTAIDGCYTVEGSCGSPGNPAGGGSIMSYCHLAGGPGISFNVGFGPQPGNVIRNSVANANCLSSGCAGGGGGGGGATCNDGIQNGNETGVDCGGSCAPCGGGCNAPTANEVGSSNIANTTATLNYNGSATFADYQYRASGSGTWIGTNYSSNG
ncbi:M12 family metallo-peptidase, partial [Lewinella cohaerens]|uniref:M12 family metallo-peptidase n=1 Tax=Lewinella cohaerens TaxID=70995 RepID=UPI00037FD394